jgi:hypothetical protein
MKVENIKMIEMEELFEKIRKGGLNPTELQRLGQLGAYFLFVGTATGYIETSEAEEREG